MSEEQLAQLKWATDILSTHLNRSDLGIEEISAIEALNELVNELQK
tara:strand:+ start:336 stop:473 length:138 start_codon:yes stop_codon:yes gene_type:complete